MKRKFIFEQAVIPIVIIILVVLMILAYYNRRAQDELISALIVSDPIKTELTSRQVNRLMNLSGSEMSGLLKHVFRDVQTGKVPSNQAILLAGYFNIPNLYVAIQNLKRHEMRTHSYVERCNEICAYDFAEAMYENADEQACKRATEYTDILNVDHSLDSLKKVIEPLNERFLAFLLKEPDSLDDFLKLNQIEEESAKERAKLLIIYHLGLIGKEKKTPHTILKLLLINYQTAQKNKVHFLENALLCLKQRGIIH